MRFPFVSRERLEETERRLRASEQEREMLLDRIALLRGEPPIYTKPEPPLATRAEPMTSLDPVRDHVAAAATESETPDSAEVLAGSVTFDYVRRKAQQAIREGKTGSVRYH